MELFPKHGCQLFWVLIWYHFWYEGFNLTFKIFYISTSNKDKTVSISLLHFQISVFWVALQCHFPKLSYQHQKLDPVQEHIFWCFQKSFSQQNVFSIFLKNNHLCYILMTTAGRGLMTISVSNTLLQLSAGATKKGPVRLAVWEKCLMARWLPGKSFS